MLALWSGPAAGGKVTVVLGLQDMRPSQAATMGYNADGRERACARLRHETTSTLSHAHFVRPPGVLASDTLL